MHKKNTLLIPFLFALSLFIYNPVWGQSNQSSTNGKAMRILPNKYSLQEQAENFSMRIGNLIGLTETQKKQVARYRFEYLKKLQELELNSKNDFDKQKKYLNELQTDYDNNFASVLTEAQKDKIENREFNR